MNIMEKIPESTPARKVCTHLTQFLKMFHFFPSENMRQVAHRQASSSAFTLERIILFYSRVEKKKSRKKQLYHPLLCLSKSLFPNIRDAEKCAEALRSPRQAYKGCIYCHVRLQHQPQCPGLAKWWRNHTLMQNHRIHFSARSLLKKVKIDLYADCGLV